MIYHHFLPSANKTTDMISKLALKYTDYQNKFLLSQINDVIEEKNILTVQILKQQTYLSEEVQYLKRWYHLSEFQSKIQILSEYYRFHRNIPKLYDVTLVDILGWYYSKYRHIDYKIMKNKLKIQQGIEMTTQKSLSSFTCSNLQIKSKYSNMLDGLQENQNHSDSNFLKIFCEKFDENHKFKKKIKIKQEEQIKSIHQIDPKFQNYLKKIKIKKRFKNCRKESTKQNLHPNKQLKTLERRSQDKQIFRRHNLKPSKQSIQRYQNNCTISNSEGIKDRSNGSDLVMNLFENNNKHLERRQSHKIIHKKSHLKINNNFQNLAKDHDNLERQRQTDRPLRISNRQQRSKSMGMKRNPTLDTIRFNRYKIENANLDGEQKRSKSSKRILKSKNHETVHPLQAPKSGEKAPVRSQSKLRIQYLNNVVKSNNGQSLKKIKKSQNNITSEGNKTLTLEALLKRKLVGFKTQKRIF